jgi:hypothetical protein
VAYYGPKKTTEVMAETGYACEFCGATPQVINRHVRPDHHRECPLGRYLRSIGIHPRSGKQENKRGYRNASTEDSTEAAA